MEKFKVSFVANNQQLTATGTKHASDTYADIEATFALGERWTDMDSVSAVWWNDFTRIATVLDSEGKCTVPHEVLMRKGCVRVNLVGSVVENGELVTRLTSYSAEAVHVNEKIKLAGNEPQTITPSQYEQFVENVKTDADRAETAKESAQDASASAQGYAQSASASATSASESATSAEQAKQSAQASAQSAQISAQTAESAKDDAESARDEILGMRAEAVTLPEGSEATASYADGLLSLGIPRGNTGATGAKGDTGETGATPNLTIGNVETLEPTEPATATITGTAENPVLNLGIPQGDTGEVSLADLSTLLPTDTASGDIASFPDGQNVIPLLSLLADIEPIQDLHGYDKPWSGGGGKNLVPNKSPNVPVSYAGVTMTIDGNDFVFKGTSTGTGGRLVFMTESFPLKSGTYFISVSLSGSGDVYPVLHNANGNVVVKQGSGAVTIAEDINAFVGFNVSETIGATFDLKVKCQLESGSTATSYEPYSNICPISGRTEVVTSVSGVNVWDEEWEQGIYNNTNGNKASGSGFIRCKNKISVRPNVTYYYKQPSAYGAYGRFCFYDADENFTEYKSGSAYVNNTITIPSNAYYMTFYVSGTTYNHDISINYPSTDHEYHAYNGSTCTTPLGRTVYGGTLDVVSGELVVDRALVDLGTLNWAYRTWGGHNQFNTTLADSVNNPAGGISGMISSAYTEVSPNTFYTNGADGTMTLNGITVRIANSNYSDAASFKSAMSGVQLVYELATPQTIQLTPQEVHALLGQNNVWADSGSVEVVYKADVGLYIDKKLN